MDSPASEINNKEDEYDLDHVNEESMFSITEDAQYPLFDADTTKREVLGLMPRSTFKKEESHIDNIPKLEEPVNFIQRNSSHDFMSLSKHSESFAKLDEERKEESTYFERVAPIPRFRPSDNMNSSQVPGPSPRQIMPFRAARPTPVKSPVLIGTKVANDLSPRVKMMPLLAERMSKVNNNGCFSKVVPKSNKTEDSSNLTLENNGIQNYDILNIEKVKSK